VEFAPLSTRFRSGGASAGASVGDQNVTAAASDSVERWELGVAR